MAPLEIKGRLSSIEEKEGTIEDVIATIETVTGTKELTMLQKRPVRSPLKVKKTADNCPPSHGSTGY